MRRFITSLSFLALFLSGLWALLFLIDPNFISPTWNRIMAGVLLAGLIGAVYYRSDKEEDDERLYWLFPGDIVTVNHVSGRPLLKKAIGKEFEVKSFSPLTKEIGAENKEIGYFYFKCSEVTVVKRSSKLIELTNKANKYQDLN